MIFNKEYLISYRRLLLLISTSDIDLVIFPSEVRGEFSIVAQALKIRIISCPSPAEMSINSVVSNPTRIRIPCDYSNPAMIALVFILLVGR